MMNTWKVFLTAIFILFVSPAVLAQTSTPSGSAVTQEGESMIKKGDDMIRQGQLLKEHGQKLIQDGGMTAPAEVVAPAAAPPSVTAPPKMDPSQLLQNAGQYQKYVEQGQKLIKNPKGLIPGIK